VTAEIVTTRYSRNPTGRVGPDLLYMLGLPPSAMQLAIERWYIVRIADSMQTATTMYRYRGQLINPWSRSPWEFLMLFSQQVQLLHLYRNRADAVDAWRGQFAWCKAPA